MPSGGITITPGFQFAPGEKVNNAKLNQLGQGVGRVDEGAITDRELSSSVSNIINSLVGKNLLCNGAFQIWFSNLFGPGLTGTGYNHDYAFIPRWVLANDANRTMTRQQFPTGSTEVPGGLDFLRWVQSANLAFTPAYLGQRLEDVRRFGGLTVAFSIYLRAATNLTVIPKMRQVFGGVKRSMTGTIVHPFTPDGRYTDGAGGFRTSDIGSTLAVTGTGYAQSGTIITYFNPGLVAIDNTGGAIASNLNALVTSPPGSAEVITAGDGVDLVGGVWTRLEQVFEVPDVTGKTIPDAATGSFTEFRVDAPQGATFQIDFANAQLELATAATAFERRLMYDDQGYARYYLETKQILLSNNVNVWKPFLSFDPKLVRPIIRLGSISSGTGGLVELEGTLENFAVQFSDHNVIATAIVTADSEIRN